jgi:hypothetical protein
MSVDRWEDEGGLYEDDDLYSLDETCPRCGEFYEEPGRPCVYCGFDPLYD